MLFFAMAIQKIAALKPFEKIFPKKLSLVALVLILLCVVSLAADAYYTYTLDDRQFTPAYKDLQEVSGWLKQNAAPNSTVYSNEWQRIYLLSDVKGYASPDHLQKPELKAFLEKNNFTYVVLLNLDKPAESIYWPEKPLLHELYAGKEVYTTESGNAIVYKIN
jgi:hypothetical protein